MLQHTGSKKQPLVTKHDLSNKHSTCSQTYAQQLQQETMRYMSYSSQKQGSSKLAHSGRLFNLTKNSQQEVLTNIQKHNLCISPAIKTAAKIGL